MALDGIFLRHIKSEIEKEALGARVSQIYQPNREELVFGLRTFSGNKKPDIFSLKIWFGF